MDTLSRYGLTRYWATTAQATAVVVWGSIVARVVPPAEQLDRLKAAEVMLQVSWRSVVNVLLMGLVVLASTVPEIAAVPFLQLVLVAVWLVHTAALLDGLSRLSRMNRAAIRTIKRAIDIDAKRQRQSGNNHVMSWDTGDLAPRAERESWARPKMED